MYISNACILWPCGLCLLCNVKRQGVVVVTLT